MNFDITELEQRFKNITKKGISNKAIIDKNVNKLSFIDIKSLIITTEETSKILKMINDTSKLYEKIVYQSDTETMSHTITIGDDLSVKLKYVIKPKNSYSSSIYEVFEYIYVYLYNKGDEIVKISYNNTITNKKAEVQIHNSITNTNLSPLEEDDNLYVKTVKKLAKKLNKQYVKYLGHKLNNLLATIEHELTYGKPSY